MPGGHVLQGGPQDEPEPEVLEELGVDEKDGDDRLGRVQDHLDHPVERGATLDRSERRKGLVPAPTPVPHRKNRLLEPV